MSEFEGRGKSRDVGYVSARRSAPEPRERTAKQKAEDAAAVARNLDGFEQRVHDGIAAMSAAAQANDRTAWDAAKREADAGVRDLRAHVKPALEAATGATDAQVRERLATIEEILKAAEKATNTASAQPPTLRAPELGIADDLLAALPPDHQVSPAEQFYKTAKLAVEWVFRERASSSDIAAFKEIVTGHRDHEIARRFRRFGREKQGELLAVLEKNEVKLPARAREQERKREAAAAAQRAPVGELPAPGPTRQAATDDSPEQSELTPSETAQPAPEPTVAGEREHEQPAADDVALVQRKARGAADVKHGGRGELAETFDPETQTTRSDAPATAGGAARAALGPQIAAAAGATYTGEGGFQIPELPGALITVQRTATAARQRRTASGIVLEIPRGLAEEELAHVTIEQLTRLREESLPTTEDVAADGVRDAADLLPHHEQIQHAFGEHRIDHVRAQIGGPAAEATAQLGATAYATGDRVGFDKFPALHTAAHEAAHVVQQRAGVALKGNVGEAGDIYEQHADAVADQVDRGESAEALLDELAPRASGTGGATSAAVQRKGQGAQPAGATAAAGDHTLVRKPDQKWHVFAASGKPYIIEARNGKPGAWVVRDWVTADPDCTKTDLGWMAPARARELLTALGWIEPARLEFAVAQLRFPFTRSYEYLPLGAEGMRGTGLPPGESAVVERAQGGALKATIRLDDPSLPPGTPHEMTASEHARAVQAFAKFTDLAVDPKGLPDVQTYGLAQPYETGNGTLFVEWWLGAYQSLFGFDAYERWRTGKPPERKPDDKTPKLKLENYYKRPIPGELSHHADIVESGEQVRLEALVNWPVDSPNPAIYEIVPMVTPSKFGTVSLLQCNWRFERLAAGGTKPAAPATTASAAQDPRGDAAAASTAPAAGATSTAGPASTGAAATATAPAVPSASPVASPVSPGAAPEQAATEIAEVFHRFKLAPGEASATFRVTCDARCDAYFAPATFTRDVVVMSSAAALSSLRTAAFAGLGGDDAARQGSAWTADASAALTASPPTGGADATARGRATQRTQLEAVRAHLGNNPASADAVAAIDRELARQAKTEQLLAQDRARGWQPFQLRGTYLSRTEGLASGPLDLHATVRVEHEYDGSGSEAGLAIYRNEYVVQIRDLSRRFEQQDFTFEGRGDSFDRALSDAFEDLAVAYPKGMLAIEAEQLASRAGAADGEAVVGARTGKVVGFQRSTETTWKKVKETVWDPVASLAVNLGAIALMTLVPGSAAIVAPAIIAYNSIPAVDRIATESTRGTLTTDKFATAAGEIALNLLPVLGRARPFTAGWFAIETANWGGQVALMTATAVDIARGVQAQQVAALAAEYQAFLQLQQRSLPSDPNLAAAEAAIRNRAAKVSNEISKQINTQILENGIVMVTGSVIHHSSAHARTAIVEHLARRAPGNGAPDAVRAPDTASPRPVGSDGAAPPPKSETPDDRATSPHADRGTTRPGAAPPARAPIVLAGDDVLARDVARNVIPRPGYVDVVVHGDADSFWVIRSDVDISIDQRAFATYLRKHGLDGQKIRLISCETGQHPQGVAQHLANQLKVEVLAPDDVAWVHWDGTITIGDKDQNVGNWVPFERKASQRSPELEAKRKSRQPSDDDASQKDDVDHDAGQTAITARHDQRARAHAATEAELSRLLGAHVVFDATLANGVDVKAKRVKKLFGFDLEVTEVRVGRDALLADVLAHKSTIETIERYNGVVGSLRKLADRYAAWRQRRQGQLDATPKHGSREWVTQQELLKLDVLLTQRRADFGQGTVDARTVTGEIAFLEGRRAYHAEVLRTLEDGRGADDDFTISGPDVGRVTQEAIASGYRLPGAAEGVQSDWYYYRHRRSDPNEFELALKGSAPYDAPSFQARVVGGRFTGIEVPKRTEPEEFPYEWTAEQVVTRLRKTDGFKNYALMLEHNGFASRNVIDGVVQHMRSQRMNSGKPVIIDQVRHDVKEYFEPRIMERLLDPRLSDQASWQQLRALLDEVPSDGGNVGDLPGADRGNLVEKWYRGRHLPNAQAHVNVGVERTSGLNAGKVEPRVIDMVDGNTAVEIKDVQGKLDDAQLGQLGAYLDMIGNELKSSKGTAPPDIQKLRYVFTKPEGAIANLMTFAKALQRERLQGRLEVKVFDWDGNQHSVVTEAQALALHARLSRARKSPP